MRYEIAQVNQDTAVTLQQAKKHCRIVTDDEDDNLRLYIRTAENYILRRRNLALKPTTFKVYIEKEDEGKTELVLPVCPVISIDGAYTFASGQPSKLQGSFTAGDVLTVVAGFDEVPSDLQAAVLLYTSERYENRELNSVVSLNEVPKAFSDLIYHWGFSN